MSLIRETCGCGAIWEGNSPYVEEREKFREAHAACRTQPDSNQRYTAEEWKERLFGDEPIGAMLTLLGERDWGLLHTDPGAVDPVSLVQTTSTDLRAALEAAFNKANDHSEEGGG